MEEVKGKFRAKNENGEKRKGKCLKSDFINLINENKAYYKNHTITYYLDGSITAVFTGAYLMYNDITTTFTPKKNK